MIFADLISVALGIMAAIWSMMVLFIVVCIVCTVWGVLKLLKDRKSNYSKKPVIRKRK